MEVNQVAEAGEKQFEARSEKSEKGEKERLAKFREELKKKPSFYSENVMNTRIYGKEMTKSEDPMTGVYILCFISIFILIKKCHFYKKNGSIL